MTVITSRESLANDWHTACNNLSASMAKEYEAKFALTTTRAVLLEARNAINVKYADDQKALGSNDTARAAKIAEMTAAEAKDVQECEKVAAFTSYLCEQARLEKERAKELRRIIVGVEVSP